MKETLSAWMDSELSAQQAGTLLPQIERDAQLRQDWDCYHLIGDTLRGVHGADLCAGIRARLDAEPTVLAPRKRVPASVVLIALAAAASVATVGVVGWIGSQGGSPAPVPVVAKSATAEQSIQPVASTATVVPAAAANVQEYLVAHRQVAPTLKRGLAQQPALGVDNARHAHAHA